jgi:hypothetical protein
MSKELDKKVEAELKKLAEESINVRNLVSTLSKNVDKAREALEKQEPDIAYKGIEAIDRLYKDVLGRINIVTTEQERHNNIMVGYQNSRLTKELVRQNRLLTIFTGVLALATFLLFLATLIDP